MSEFKDDNPEKTAEETTTVEKTETSDENRQIKIGEREFNDIDDLGKSWSNAQDHIKKIEAENLEFRNKQIEQNTIDDLVKRLDNKGEEGETEEKEQPSVDISALISEKLAERDAKTSEESNYSDCMTEARKVLGSGFVEDLKQKSIELFGSESRGVDLAKESPAAFKQLFLPEKTVTTKPTTTNFNSSSFQSDGKKTDFWKADRKEQAAIIAEERIAMKKELGLV